MGLKRALAFAALAVLLLHADVADAKKKSKKTKKTKAEVKSTANLAVETRLAEIAGLQYVVDQIDALDRLIVQHPKEPQYFLARGQARVVKDFLPNAIKDFDKVISLDPEFSTVGKIAVVAKADILAKKPEAQPTALALLEVLAEELDSPYMEGAMKRCEVLNKMARYEDSIPICSSVVNSKNHKDDYEWNNAAIGWAFFYRAAAYERTSQFKLALADYEGCISAWGWLPVLDSSTASNATVAQRQLRTAHFNRAELRCGGICGGEFAYQVMEEFGDEGQDIDGAIADYLAVKNSPLTTKGTTNWAVSASRVGLAYLKQEKNQEAVSEFSEAISAVQTEVGWWLNRGLAWARMDKYKEATADYSKAIELDPKSTTAYNNRGIIYQRRQMWSDAIDDFTVAVLHARGDAKGDPLIHRAFCHLSKGDRKKALKDANESCEKRNTKYSCAYNTEETLDGLDMNKDLEPLPSGEDEEKETQERLAALKATEEADAAKAAKDAEVVEEEGEDSTWVPVGALLASDLKVGDTVTVGATTQLQAAWASYDEWSEDYAWQAEKTGVVKELDMDDGTALVNFGVVTAPKEGATAVKQSQPQETKVSFESAPIKHIKDKTLGPFKKKFEKSVVMYYRSAELCGHCTAVKPVFAKVADWVMARTKEKNFAFAAIDCGYAKAAAKPLCDSIWDNHQGVDGSRPGTKSSPRIMYYGNRDWDAGEVFADPINLGEHAGQMREWLANTGVEAAVLTEADVAAKAAAAKQDL